jgi:trehalose 6-phosphate phosphatase
VTRTQTPTPAVDPALLARLEAIAQVPVLLVATDFDGTLAPIVEDPAAATADREALVALRRLASLDQTHVAIVSGRSLADLVELTGDPPDVRLVGSHGSEFEPDFAGTLPPATLALRDRLERELATIAERFAGAQVEEKSVGAAFHYRRVESGQHEAARAAVLDGPGRLDGVHVRSGKCVVELCVVATHKGTALETLRGRVGASAAVFAGDDVTDEDAFATLRGPDLAVKVGPGETCAPLRVADTRAIARMFAILFEFRAAWLSGGGAPPIQELTLLSDQRAVALVEPRGRINWLCAPSIDSQAVMCELLGGAAAGHFTIRPDVDGPSAVVGRTTYDGDTLIARTRFDAFDVVDYLDASMGRPTQRPGRTDLVRVVEPRANAGGASDAAHGRAVVEFAPRLNYGRHATQLDVVPGGLVVRGALQPIVLLAPGVEWTLACEGVHRTARATLDLANGPVTFELRFGTNGLEQNPVPESRRRQRTAAHWEVWARQLELPSALDDRQRAEVLRSALTLRALCHGPSGGIAAAATTSLPEHVGGVRNWDYRFTWVRDAALSADALVRLGSQSEAMAYLDWLHDVLSRSSGPEQLRPLYMVSGQDVDFEAEIGELAGYAGSRPVRIGNAAASQVQLDVFGPIASLVYELGLRGAPLSFEHWRLVEDMVRAVERRWDEPDHGIWEIRKAPRHHVHSRAMCWLTLDRAIALAERMGERCPSAWAELRDRIKAEILERGYDPQQNAFTAAYDGDDLDAAVLLLGPIGLIDATDPRFVGTIRAIEAELLRGADAGHGPTLLRYDSDDGLPGTEGGFHILTLWLADAHLCAGDRARAQELYEAVARAAGTSGLLSEQLDPVNGSALGNHPQAYSHLALIGTALRLSGGFDAPGRGA